MMDQPLTFDRLPEEIIALCFEVAFESRCSSTAWDWDSPQSDWSWDVDDFRSLLVPIHCSAGLREIAFSHSRLWRSIAELVCMHASVKISPQAPELSGYLSLLSLSADSSQHSLDRIHLDHLFDRRQRNRPEACLRGTPELLEVLIKSAAS